MALMVRPEPFSREVDRFFDAFFGQPERAARRWVPPMDLVEAEDHFVLKADLPGMAEEDVKIEFRTARSRSAASARRRRAARARLVPHRALVRRLQPFADALRASGPTRSRLSSATACWSSTSRSPRSASPSASRSARAATATASRPPWRAQRRRVSSANSAVGVRPRGEKKFAPGLTRVALALFRGRGAGPA